MKCFFAILFIQLFWSPTFGQMGALDSLIMRFNTELVDSQKVHLAEELANQYATSRQNDTAIYYYKIAVELAKNGDGVSLGTASRRLAQTYFSANNMAMALATIDSATLAHTRALDTSGILKSHITKGAFHNKNGNHSEAIFVYKEALKLTDSTTFPGLRATLLNELSLPYAALGDDETSIDYLIRAIEIREKINPKYVGVSYGNLANTYKRQENYPEAIKQYQNSLSLMEDPKFLSNRIVCLRNLGDTYTKIGKYRLAVKTLKQSYDLAQSEPDNQRSLAMYHFLMATVHHEQKNHDSVLVQCQLVTDILGERMPPLLKTVLLMKVSNSHFVLSQTQPDPPQLAKAVEIGEEAMVLAKQANSFKHINGMADLLMKVYSAVPNAEKTLEYAKLYGSSLDSMNKIERSKKVVSMQAKFEVEKKELEIELLNKDNQLKEKALEESAEASERKGYVVIASLLGLLFSLVIVALLFYQSGQRKKTNAELLEKNQTISKQNTEKELLLKEIHHRVKNNLQVVSSLLDLQSKKTEDEAAQSAISDGQNRVKAMALIHHNLYQNEDLGHIPFKDYAEQLLKQVTSIFPMSRTVSSQVKGDSVLLDIDTAVPLGLILNELLSNAFKYAFHANKGSLEIVISQLENQDYQLQVKDNGPGLPENFNIEKAKSMGLRLVRRLSKQLYGTVNYQNLEGSLFTVTFKDTSQRRAIQ